jgi:hypothetical protein
MQLNNQCIKKSNPTVKAQILRSVFYLLLLLGVCAIPFALARRSFGCPTTSATSSTQTQRTLTFANRIAYQRAIEDVYWRHRVWPRERPDSKPPLDAVMTRAQIEKKVQDYLRDSQALEDYWQWPITSEQPGVEPVFPKKDQAIAMHRTAPASAQVRFGFLIQAATSSASFRSMTRIESCDCQIQLSSTRDYFSVISRMSFVPMISRISRRFTCNACC